MNRTKHALPYIALTAVVVLALLFVAVGGKDALSDREDRKNVYMMSQALTEVMRKARDVYYKEIDQEKLYEGAIKGALSGLDDPYSFYLSPRDLQREAENLYHATFGGLGIHIYASEGVVRIYRPLPNTPAMSVGLQAGDDIIKVNGDPIHIGGPTGKTLQDIVDVLRGEVGTDVTITVRRRGRVDPFDVTLTRAKIEISSVEKDMLEGGIGYILIRQFTGRTNQEFWSALNELRKAEGGMKALVLDLRHNPGGLLDAANYVVDAFISNGVIVSTKGRRSSFNQIYRAKREVLCSPEVPLVVMVNEFSASGSEIVAGAIKDTKRGVLLGTKTFGKGLVQQRFPLKNGGGAVSLTVSTYYTPNGTSINETGVMPHVVLEPDKLDTVEELLKWNVPIDDYIREFVQNWIEVEEKRVGKTPKDFSKFQPQLPELMKKIEANEVVTQLSPDRAKLETEVDVIAHRVFNRNVGIQQLTDLDHDNQLQEAVRILKAGEVKQILAAKPNTANL
jgi:carboxyl-terminal processing protease